MASKPCARFLPTLNRSLLKGVFVIPRLCLALSLLLAVALAQSPRHGFVRDALGRPVANATVTLRNASGTSLASARTDAQGGYELPAVAGATRISASAPGLAPLTVPLASAPSILVLGLAAVETTINVTALREPIPAAQVGNATSTLDRNDLRLLNFSQAVTALRLQPGLTVVQSGQTGAETSVFLRGAPGDFTAVLLDGVPIQRLDAGGYDFANLLPSGVAEIQVLRGPDSVVYGSDAAAGVIALRTRRGDEVPVPEFDSTTQAGAYGAFLQDNQLLGQWSKFDYAFRYGYLGTHNQVPNSKFRDNTWGGNLGWRVSPASDLRLTLHRSFSNEGEPGALLFNGLPAGNFKHQGETYGGLVWQQRISSAWRQRISASESQSNLFDNLPGPFGISDGAGSFDGLPVTIRGANGFQVSGRAVVNFGGPFPQAFGSDTRRRDLGWESDLSLTPQLSLLGGYRYYDERGLSSSAPLSRHDNGAFGVLQAGVGSRWFFSGGGSVDRNTPFGTSGSPQASLAFYPRLRRSSWWDETRLRASAGTALKDPSLIEEQSSLFQALIGAPGGPALIRQFGLSAIQPQRARDLDAGVDQYLAGGNGLLSVTWFDHRYYNLIEFIPTSALVTLGVPPAAAAATAALGGAEFNSLTTRARGLELESRLRFGTHWQLAGAYTATAAKVLRSFSFDATAPTINPVFPNVPIGAFSPLVGARPFRVAPQTGSLDLRYFRGRFTGLANAYFASRRDDSTFLTDSNFGNTLLLPNRNLDPAYGIVNLSGTFRLNSRLDLLAAVDNALDHAYQEVLGFPAPRISGRLGLRWTWSRAQ